MEYLMTYGWALLVIVVVGAALFALGVLNPTTYQQKRCQGFQYMTYQDHRVNTTHAVLDVINGPRAITVNSLTVQANTDTNEAVTGSLSGGGRFQVEGTHGQSASVGDSYSWTVGVSYDVTGGIAGNLDQGTCTGTVA